MATLRWAGQFDPAQSLRIKLIQINAKGPEPNHVNKVSADDPEWLNFYDLTETLCLRAFFVAKKPHRDEIRFSVPFCSLGLSVLD